MANATLKKEERLKNFRLIEQIFCKDMSHSLSVYPLRVLYMTHHDGNKMLVTVSKRCFKHAVDRNRIKRQVREAYRKNKSLLDRKNVIIAFVWLSERMLPSVEVERRVVTILKRINDAED